jgi:MFS family permease
MGKAIFLWAVIVLAIVAGWLLVPHDVWRYLFFARIPLLAGLLLVGLPIIATSFLPAVLRNLFVLRGQWQLAFVIVSAIAAGMAVMLTAFAILHNASARFNIDKLVELPESWQYIIVIAIGFPICFTTAYLSKEKLRDKQISVGVITGAGLSLAFLFVLDWIRQWLDSSPAIKKLLTGAIAFLSKYEAPGYINPQNGELTSGHITAVAFLLVGFFVYCLIGIYLQPKPRSDRPEAPALLFLMLIVSELNLLSAGATFYFDYYRVPTLILFILFSGLSYLVFCVDHFFNLKSDKRSNKKDDRELQNFKAIIDKRLAHQKDDRTLVIVCASGGGIQAAGWTAQVLTGCQEVLGKSFTKSIGLISSVSGGSVGAMYYLDRFNDHGYADIEYVNDRGFPEQGNSSERKFTTIFRSSTKDSLDAVGWGLAYPDLWRMIGVPFLAPKLCDRGTAIEKDWQGELKCPRSAKTLATWRQQVLNGQIPIPAFNATLVEDGRRFLISPMTFGESPAKKYVDFNTLYGDYDIDVVTAARLSATFPYVSPICRNTGSFSRNYHVADGGYFDNSGFVTVVEWLGKLLEPANSAAIKRILILQINAFPDDASSLPKKVKGEGGWFMATIGPLLALFKVRDPILAARNSTEAELLVDEWKHQTDIKYFSIFFPSMKELFPNNGKNEEKAFYRNDEYQPPLSWKLTDLEKEAIAKGWKVKASDPNGVIQDIKRLWHNEWKMPKD